MTSDTGGGARGPLSPGGGCNCTKSNGGIAVLSSIQTGLAVEGECGYYVVGVVIVEGTIVWTFV